MTQKRIGIIGCGAIALQYAKVLEKIEDAVLVGFCGRGVKNIKAFQDAYPSCKLFRSVSELCLIGELDGIIIAVSEENTLSCCREAFDHDVQVLVEKPAGVNLDEHEQLVRYSQLNYRNVYIALNRRYFHSTISASNCLATVNSPRLVTVVDAEDPRSAAVRKKAVVIDNWMYANSIHLVDYFTKFCRGDRLNVRTTYYPIGEGLYLNSTILYSSGDIGQYQSYWNLPGPWAVSIVTDSVHLEMKPLEGLLVKRVGDKRPLILDSDRLDLDFKPGFYRQTVDFIRQIQGYTTELTTLRQGLESTRLVNEIYGKEFKTLPPYNSLSSQQNRGDGSL